jgi:hypothetical protein
MPSSGRAELRLAIQASSVIPIAITKFTSLKQASPGRNKPVHRLMIQAISVIHELLEQRCVER